MGYWYWRPLKTSWDLDHAVTQRFDLPERGYLSGLLLKLDTNNALALTKYNDPYPMQRIDFRVTGNGNKEIIDLRGRQLQAMNYWDKGSMPWDTLNTIIGQGITQYSFIPFGRYMGDEKYGLILDKFDAGIQFEESNTFEDAKYTSGSSKLTVYGMFRKDPDPGTFNDGFLKKRQIMNKNTASEKQYAVKLPTRNKIRQINMFTEPDLDGTTFLPKTGPFTNLEYIWLGLKSKEEYILNKMSATQWARFIHLHYNRKPETKIWTVSGAATPTTIDTMVYEREDSIVQENPGNYPYFVVLGSLTMWERIERLHGWKDDGAQQAINCYLRNQGICYHGHVPLLMQDPMSDESEWLDAEEQKDVYVEWDESASVGNIYVVLDELQKTYPT